MEYAAFVRALNVGSHNRIRMDALRDLCATAGLASVRSYLQTGNLVFEADDAEAEVAERLEAAFAEAGLRNAAVMVRSRKALEDVLAGHPFAAFPGAQFRRWVLFLREPLPPGFAVKPAMPGLEIVARRPREILAAGPIGTNVFLELPVSSTTRYWQVVEGLRALWG